MTPPDGAEPPRGDGDLVSLPATQAILLHGGRALVLFEGATIAPPRAGQLGGAGVASEWTAESWRVETEAGPRWCGLAVVDVLPQGGGELVGASGLRRWHVPGGLSVDISPQPLADLVRKAGVDRRRVFEFLMRQLIEGCASDSAEAQAHRVFARGFFTAAAERDGFIEILAEPDCGGIVAQGWSMSLPTGPVMLASVAGDLAVQTVEAAHFERDDILPPGVGFCLYGKDWRVARAGEIDAVFFEKEGRLLRLDVVSRSVIRFEGAEATGHVGHMLPRLQGPEPTLRAFRRICRPRFAGEDTLSRTDAPIALGLDALLQAPDGGLLAFGWLLDPLRRVELAIVKSTGNLYAQLQKSWIRLPRPDLCSGFASDPRFAGLLDPQNALYGFIVHVPPPRGRTKGAQVYLELCLDDESCLFRPLTVTAFEDPERLPQILAGLSHTEPELARIIEEHLAPFLEAVPPRAPALARAAAARPVPLGVQRPARDVSALMPVRGLAELQAVFGLLGGTPDAEALDLTLICSRDAAADLMRPLDEAFRFYGLSGALVIASERDTLAARLDAGVAATEGRWVLAWSPQALPKHRGWVEALCAEAEALEAPGLLSPALTYEDGSVCFAGAQRAASGRTAEPLSALAGYAGGWLARGLPARAAAGAADIALLDRGLLAAAGGFAGHLFGEGYAHLDLAARLRAQGAETWCSGLVEFWMLETAQAEEATPLARLLREVDASLLKRRQAALVGDV